MGAEGRGQKGERRGQKAVLQDPGQRGRRPLPSGLQSGQTQVGGHNLTTPRCSPCSRCRLSPRGAKVTGTWRKKADLP